MKITLDTKIYPLEAILNAAYNFIDRAYVFLDEEPKAGKIRVLLNGKKKLIAKQEAALKGEFMNDLLNSVLRLNVSRNNKKITEHMLGRAFYSLLRPSDYETADKDLDYMKDAQGIAVPWEEKYGKTKTRNKI
ncbi:MAG: His-Xaa-Ser system protein HxsD [Candidatus Omnitrophica bacterium]|nr:His-Xaa-Ser system protein HxsD [Candidatus Omnitrophota bacterium]